MPLDLPSLTDDQLLREQLRFKKKMLARGASLGVKGVTSTGSISGSFALAVNGIRVASYAVKLLLINKEVKRRGLAPLSVKTADVAKVLGVAAVGVVVGEVAGDVINDVVFEAGGDQACEIAISGNTDEIAAPPSDLALSLNAEGMAAPPAIDASSPTVTDPTALSINDPTLYGPDSALAQAQAAAYVDPTLFEPLSPISDPLSSPTSDFGPLTPTDSSPTNPGVVLALSADPNTDSPSNVINISETAGQAAANHLMEGYIDSTTEAFLATGILPPSKPVQSTMVQPGTPSALPAATMFGTIGGMTFKHHKLQMTYSRPQIGCNFCQKQVLGCYYQCTTCKGYSLCVLCSILENHDHRPVARRPSVVRRSATC